MSLGGYLIVKILLHLGEVLAQLALYMAVDICLLAALVVGVCRLHAAAGHPSMIVCPAVCIVEVPLLPVHLIERHESLVVYGTCP